jgi:hypothetical protein
VRLTLLVIEVRTAAIVPRILREKELSEKVIVKSEKVWYNFIIFPHLFTITCYLLLRLIYKIKQASPKEKNLYSFSTAVLYISSILSRVESDDTSINRVDLGK